MVSKEDKKAKKEAKKLEKLRAEAELRKKLKRQELEREIAIQARKRGDLDKSWRDLMLKIKEPVFRQEIQVMSHVFERTYDKKDYFIKYTMQLMDTADDQFQRTVASFCETIDTMINKFLSEMEQLSKLNDLRKSRLLKAGEDEAARITADHNTAETHLQLLLYHGHTTADTLAWTTRGENLVKEDEDRSKYTSEIENLRSYLENIYSLMWDEYKTVLKAYIIETSENLKRVRRLRRKENLMADIIASQAKKIANSDGLLKRLRTELAAYESGTKQAVFRDRRNRHRAACFRLKKTLLDGCATDAKQMAKLVRMSDDATEWLESANKQAEKILRMAALCRKFETQREKVMPFGSNESHLPTETKVSLRHQQSNDSLLGNAIASTGGLTRLWQRISKADLSRRALIREKMLLEEENTLIIQKIQELKENNITPHTKKCMCNTNSKTSVPHPVAIDGVLEVTKYR
ncbi:dynein regulatory complex subunit 2-like [Maniola hyperantus]|uniref:dynein regulatory complex subunit 2-like n=1 Tax=Aphantopus hyperantus TaxID=2795564 RepID=UPI001567DA8A|nr:dynein regulatory complex subunit 2-like [Maniola hyperantus]